MNSLLDFEYSPWLIILCLVLGVGYGYVQYRKKSPWSLRINLTLAVIRAVLVFLIALLFLGPTVTAVKNYYEKPLLIIAVDNSESVALTAKKDELTDLKDQLQKVSKAMTNNGWQVKYVNLLASMEDLDSLNFSVAKTDLTGMIRRVQSGYEGANLAGILVVSDGIFNTGFSPDFISSFTPIYGIGLGDTIPRKDLSIIDIKHNKTVYQDNKHPVEISIRNEGLGPEETKLSIYQGRKLLEQVSLSISPTQRLLKHKFLVEAKDPGKQRITLVLDSVPNELTSINNRKSFYIDVVEGKQKVLIVADVPSPDIKAIRLAIEQNEHFLVDVIVGEDAVETLDYDLIIFNQVPGKGTNKSVYEKLKQASVPRLYIVGSTTNINFLTSDAVFDFRQSNGQFDQVTAYYNTDFKGFILNSDLAGWLISVPPITVPYGKLLLSPTDQVLLLQQVGNVSTKVPLIFFSEGDQKQGVLFGDGIWRWRLNEFQQYGETTRFDELITKTVMYLASKPDNRQFKMYPVKDSYEFGENIIFIAETYNELFEPVYGEQVSLKISGNDYTKRYSFTPLEGSRQLNIENLPEGVYQYSAQTSLNGKNHRVSGQFSIEVPNLEVADLTADYTMIRKLVRESGGRFYSMSQMFSAVDDFSVLEAPTIIHTQEKEFLLLNPPWILIFLLALVTGEWLTRKMMGGY